MQKYREGKAKRTPARGVKQNLKPWTGKMSRARERLRRVFCRINLRVALRGEAKGSESRSRSESEPEQGEEVARRRPEANVILPWAG